MKLSRLTIPYTAVSLSVKLMAVIYFTAGSFPSGSELGPFIVPLMAVLLTLVTGLYSYIRWRRFEYLFDEENLKITKGIIKRSDRDIPLKRVQNVDVKRNIIHRILGISVVSLETAGGSTTEASLKYVELSEADKIKQKIRDFKQENESDEEKNQNKDAGEELYRIDDKELLILGLTGIDQRIIFGLLGLLGFSIPSITPLLEGSGIGLFNGILVVIMVAFSVVVASNFVANLSRFYNFRLMKRKDTLEYSRGLVNRSEGSVPLRKLQRIVISDNPLKRLFDRSSLSIETAGYSRKDQELELAIPLAKKDQVRELVTQLEYLEDYSLEKIPVRTMRKYFTRYAVASTLVLSIIYLWTSEFYYISIPLFASLALLASFLKWKHIGYSELDEHFVVRKGFWNRKEIIVPYHRTQNIIMSDTILQRLWDLSSVTLDIAGTGFMSGDAKIIDIDESEAWDVSKRLHENFQKTQKRKN